jgi:hypothetical protein
MVGSPLVRVEARAFSGTEGSNDGPGDDFSPGGPSRPTNPASERTYAELLCQTGRAKCRCVIT